VDRVTPEVFQELRPLMFSIAYRMLGSAPPGTREAALRGVPRTA